VAAQLFRYPSSPSLLLSRHIFSPVTLAVFRPWMTISSRKATDKIFDGLLDDREKGEDCWYYQGDNDYEEWTGTGTQHQYFDVKVGVE
jgi:hypothetical protein